MTTSEKKPSRRKETRKPRTELPHGFSDWQGKLLEIREMLASSVERVYRQYGYVRLETPLIESLSALGSFLPDVDRPSAGVFAWRDDDEKWLGLRYDLTAPLARFIAANASQLPKPYRSCRGGHVLRNEKPGPGRFRQFVQSDADIVWAPCPEGDAEICEIAYRALEQIEPYGISFRLQISHRKILDATLDQLQLAGHDDEVAARSATIMRALDKLDRLGITGVRQLLGKGRLDESGDFTTGACLSDDQIDVLIALLDSRRQDNAATINALSDVVGDFEAGKTAIRDLTFLCERAKSSNFSPNKFVIDPSVVRGLAYYTGPVFEAVAVPLESSSSNSTELTGFGSIGGGGRYDKLVARFGGETVPACGFSLGLSRIAMLLSKHGTYDAAGTRSAPAVAMLALDAESHAMCDTLSSQLREVGIEVAQYIGRSGMRAQMRFADRSGARFAVLLGESEREAGVVTIRDMEMGKEISRDITTDRDQWREHKQQVQVAPTEVASYIAQRL